MRASTSAGVVLSITWPAAQHHGLHHTLPGKLLDVGNDALGQHIGRDRTVESPQGGRDGRVELQDIVVHLVQGFGHAGAPHHGGVAQHAHLGLRIVPVAQHEHIVNHLFKMRVKRGLAVAREGDDIERLAGLAHGLEFLAELALDALTRRDAFVPGTLCVETRLTIEAVE